MKRKGQSAMEYMATYGWALLAVIIISVVIWQMGLFRISDQITPGTSGFSILTPQEWLLFEGGGSCTLRVIFLNSAGEELTNLAVSGADACIPATVVTGDNTICTKTINICGDPGDAYEEDITVTYQRSSDNESFQTSGVVWGNVEGS
jgi:hypothetical protein